MVALVLVFVFVFNERMPGEPSTTERPGPPGTGPLTIVSMGDSTLSGEGADSYTKDTNGKDGDWCHRSSNAAVKQTTVPKIKDKINLACSGAGAEDVALGDGTHYTEASQARQLKQLIKNDHRVSKIVVAVGANDEPHFSEMINKCFQSWLYPSRQSCHDKLGGELGDKVQQMVPKVVTALEDIQQVLDDAGYDKGDTDIVLQSYASPLSPDIPESLRNLDGCPFRKADLRWTQDDAVGTLTEGIRKAADKAGVRFLNLSQAGDGHEACTGGKDPSSEWFTRLTVEWDNLSKVDRAGHAIQESFHPNRRGHAQYGRCLTEFFAMDTETGACTAGEDGQLHAVHSSNTT